MYNFKDSVLTRSEPLQLLYYCPQRTINIVIWIYINSTFRLTDFHCSEPISLYWVSYQSDSHPVFTLSAAEGGVSQFTITSQNNPVGPKLNKVQFSISGGSGNTTNTESYGSLRMCLVCIRLELRALQKIVITIFGFFIQVNINNNLL